MRIFKLFFYALLIIVVSGCSEVGGQFIGTWTNVQPTGGNLLLIISRDENDFIVKNAFADSGKILWVNKAKLKDGYLMVDGYHFFKRLSYSKTEDLLIPVNDGVNVPGFHRLK